MDQEERKKDDVSDPRKRKEKETVFLESKNEKKNGKKKNEKNKEKKEWNEKNEEKRSEPMNWIVIS